MVKGGSIDDYIHSMTSDVRDLFASGAAAVNEDAFLMSALLSFLPDTYASVVETARESIAGNDCDLEYVLELLRRPLVTRKRKVAFAPQVSDEDEQDEQPPAQRPKPSSSSKASIESPGMATRGQKAKIHKPPVPSSSKPASTSKRKIIPSRKDAPICKRCQERGLSCQRNLYGITKACMTCRNARALCSLTVRQSNRIGFAKKSVQAKKVPKARKGVGPVNVSSRMPINAIPSPPSSDSEDFYMSEDGVGLLAAAPKAGPSRFVFGNPGPSRAVIPQKRKPAPLEGGVGENREQQNRDVLGRNSGFKIMEVVLPKLRRRYLWERQGVNDR